MWISLVLGTGSAAAAYPERLRASEIERGPSAVQQAAAPIHPVLVQGGPNVVFTAQIQAGSAYDPIGREGTAWRVAQGLAAGGAGARNAADIQGLLSKIEGQWTVDVQRQLVSVQLTCPPSEASVCGGLFADALTAPRFEPEVVRALADRARAELTATTELDYIADELFVAAVYEGHAYGHPVAGRVGVLDVIGPAAVTRFYREHYVRQAISVEVSGPVSSEDLEVLDSRLLQLPSTLPPDLALYAPPRRTGGARLVVEVPEATYGAVRIGAPLRLAWSDPDGPAMWLAIAVLRSELGLPLAVPAPVQARELEDFVIPVDARALEETWPIIERWVREGVAPDWFEQTRAAAAVMQNSAFPSDSIASLSMNDVNAAIVRHVALEELSIVAVGAATIDRARYVPIAGLFR